MSISIRKLSFKLQRRLSTPYRDKSLSKRYNVTVLPNYISHNRKCTATNTQRKLTLMSKRSFNRPISFVAHLAVLMLLIAFATPLASAEQVYIVTNGNDAGTGSLRQAVLDANANSNPLEEDIIIFEESLTNITQGDLDELDLTGPIIITESVHIQGPGQKKLVIDGLYAWITTDGILNGGFPGDSTSTLISSSGTLFNVGTRDVDNTGIHFKVSGMTVRRTSGFVNTFNGAHVEIEDVFLKDNAYRTQFPSIGGPLISVGNSAHGGTLTIRDSFISGNKWDSSFILGDLDEIVISNTTFVGNSFTSQFDSGLFLAGTTTEIIDSQILDDNVQHRFFLDNMYISNSVFKNTQASALALIWADSTNLRMNNTTIYSRTVDKSLMINQPSHLWVTRSTLSMANTVIAPGPGTPSYVAESLVLLESTTLALNANNHVSDGSLPGSDERTGLAGLEGPFVNPFSFKPVFGSSLIDTGSDAHAVNPRTGAALTKDVFGGDRLRGLGVEIGAVEVQANHTVNDDITTPQGSTFTLARPGVLDNDILSGTPIGDRIFVISPPAHGAITVTRLGQGFGGGFEYVPDRGFHGTDSFQYVVVTTDGNTSNAAYVTLNVTKANTAPIGGEDYYSIATDGTLKLLIVDSASGVLRNDHDFDGDMMTAELVSTTSNGTLMLNFDGSFTYAIAMGFSGIDSFSYRATDGALPSGDTVVSISVNAVNNAPTTHSDVYSVGSDGVLDVHQTGGVLKNDSDLDGDSLTATLVSTVANGILALNLDGSFTYTPNPGYSGDDTFEYMANDGHTNSSVTQVLIHVKNTNTAPLTHEDSYSMSAGGTLHVGPANGVLANDHDPEGDHLNAVLYTASLSGTFLFNADGSFDYTAPPGFSGDATFSYIADDGHALSLPENVTIHVLFTDTLPIANDDSYTLMSDQLLQISLPFSVLNNDSDIDGDHLSVYLDVPPAHGTLHLNSDGTFRYSPDAGYFGGDSFTYFAFDGYFDSLSATVNLDIRNSDTPPIAQDDMYSVASGGTLQLGAASSVLANDSDPDGDILSAVLLTPPSNGTLHFDRDGTFTYRPDAGFVGVDSFTYEDDDGRGGVVAATVTINVHAANSPPIATDDAYQTNWATPLNVGLVAGVLSNDFDAEGNALTGILSTSTTDGVLHFDLDGGFTYRPDAGFAGIDTFTYQAFDGHSYSSAAMVSLEVLPSPNASPIALEDAYSTRVRATLIVGAADGVLANDSDPEGALLTAVLGFAPSNGSLSLDSDGAFLYVPDADFRGTDTFTYTAFDGNSHSQPATVSIKVQGHSGDGDDCFLEKIFSGTIYFDELDKFRQIRDRIFMPTATGRALVDLYYQLSPHLIIALESSLIFKTVVQISAVSLMWCINHPIFIGLMMMLIIWIKRNRRDCEGVFIIAGHDSAGIDAISKHLVLEM